MLSVTERGSDAGGTSTTQRDQISGTGVRYVSTRPLSHILRVDVALNDYFRNNIGTNFYVFRSFFFSVDLMKLGE